MLSELCAGWPSMLETAPDQDHNRHEGKCHTYHYLLAHILFPIRRGLIPVTLLDKAID